MYLHTVECYNSSLKGKEILICVVTRANLEDSGVRFHSRGSQNRFRDRKDSSGSRGWGERRRRGTVSWTLSFVLCVENKVWRWMVRAAQVWKCVMLLNSKAKDG